MLIDETFFERSIMIPNVEEPTPNNRTANVLAETIEICEDEVLSYAFGVPMWKDFKEVYKTNPDTISQVYKDILKGKTYTKDDKEYYWKGLIDYDLKKSLLADYTYYVYQTANVTQQTEFGQSSANVKVGEKASSTPKIIKAWNEFLFQLQGESVQNVSGYTQEGNPFRVISNRLVNGYGISYYNEYAGNNEVSLMKFLDDNRSSYPLLREAGVIQLERQNSFGI